MDIRILRDGIEIGPFPEETVQTLLQQGNVAITDLAWCPGMPQWVPLANLLYTTTPPPPPGSVPPPPPPPTPAASAPAPADLPQVTHEPATAKQKAFLTFMGVGFAPEISREDASYLVNEAMESPRNAARLAKWNKERLKLHPDLFAEEIQAAREQRSEHFFEVCATQGAPWFTKVTKAHCQVLVGYLDVHHPHWDADEHEAATHYFFPAIAEKFPQLLTKEAKGKFKYPEGPKVARELAQRSPVAVKARRASPVAALARGVFFGVLILGVLWFVKNVLEKGAKPAGPKVAATASPAPEAAPGGTPLADPLPANPAPEAGNPPAANPPVEAAPPANPGEMNAAGNPPAMSAADGTVASTPPATSAAPIMAALDPAAAAPPQPPPPAPPGTALLLTKPVEVPGPYGKIKLPPGTRVKLVQQNGALVTVQYAGKDVTTIPAASTNLGSDLLPAAAPGLPPPPVAPAPAPVAPAPAAPAPASDSLFGPPPTTAPGTARTNPAADL